MDSCAEEFCACHKKCRSCDQFAEEGSVFCADCVDTICWKCFKPAKKVTPTLVYINQITFIADTEGVCFNCGDNTDINQEGYCKHCIPNKRTLERKELCDPCRKTVPLICNGCKQTKETLDDNGMCIACLFGSSWEENPERAMRAGQCHRCGNMNTLSKNNICYKCHIEVEAEKEGSFRSCPNCAEMIRKDEGICPHCRMTLSMTCTVCFDLLLHGEKRICKSCRRKCVSCGEVFEQRDMRQKHCESCEHTIEDGICLMCKNHTDKLNDYGHCHYCGSADNHHFVCVVCDMREVPNLGGVCNTCKHEHRLCHSCKNTHRAYKYDCGNHNK